MIPKVIHYCWFGRGEKSELILNCIASWHRELSGYEIIEWNEDNFDIHCNPFVQEAYENRKYAFVADYARFKILYEQGGIYLDTDVEVVKEFSEEMLEQQGFSGFESLENIAAGIMGCEKGLELFGKFLHYYDDKHFVNEDGSFNDITIVDIITAELVSRGLQRNNTFQVIEGIALYPKEYLYPLEDGTGIMTRTEKTVTIHWFAKSWWDQKDIKKYKRARLLFKIFGKNFVIKCSKIKHKIFGS